VFCRVKNFLSKLRRFSVENFVNPVKVPIKFRTFDLVQIPDIMLVTFTEEGHRYMCGDVPYKSVSSLLGQFQPEFDREHWSKRSALQRILPNFRDLEDWWLNERRGSINQPEMVDFMMEFADEEEVKDVQKEILKEWKKENEKSVNKGNKYHLSREEDSYSRGYEICPIDGKKYKTFQKERIPGYNEALCENLFDLDDGYYPELLIFDHENRLAGQSDRVFIGTYRKKRYAYIDDYKTNKKMTKRSFWYKNYGNVMLLPPLDYLEHSKLQGYELQISTYAWMLERFGFQIKGVCLHHLNKKYDLKYLKKEVELMLEYGKDR